MTNTRDTCSRLETKGRILAGENYTKPKLADILFIVALTHKLPSDTCVTIKVVAFLVKDLADQDFSDSLATLITDKVTLQISSLIDNLATGVATTKEFINVVAHQQAESTLMLKESILSNTETSKAIANMQRNCQTCQLNKLRPSIQNGLCYPAHPHCQKAPYTLHQFIHTTLSVPQIKIQQHILLIAKQLLIELGPLGRDTPALG